MQEVAASSFGPWLRQRRKVLDLTQEDLAERISCSAALIRKIEAGERTPSRQVVEVLAGCLDIPPEERSAFFKFARSGTDSGAAEGTLLPARYGRSTNLSAPLTPLIGRVEEMATLRDHILRNDVRLLTLTGPPGVGKTRLGIQVALELIDHFADGAFLVALAPITDLDLVVSAIAKGLGYEGMPDQSLLGSLKSYLHGKQMLILLDNFEQVLDAAPQVVQLLEAAPQLKVICTSREALHVRCERQFPVSPLALPDLKRLPPVGELSQNPAVALFVERAQAVRPDFALMDDNAEEVATICSRLHGLPLAIELAAARVKLLSTRELLRLLESRLTLLASGARDLPARQQTLRNAIGWSYGLLNSGEQMLFARLSVFVGGCTLAAIEAVCNAEGDLPMDVLEGVASLVDKSLVRHEEGVESESYFSMLALIRDYSSERLEESGEAEDIRRLHAEYYLALAEVGAQKLQGAEQLLWLSRLDQEHNDLRAALRWVLDKAQGKSELEMALRLATALGQFWERRGYTEGRRWLEEVLARSKEVNELERSGVRARALMAAGVLARIQTEFAAMLSLFEESLAICREIGDEQGVASSLSYLGWVVGYHQKQYAEGSAMLEESVSLFSKLGDKWGLAEALGHLATVHIGQGNHAQARSLFEESLELARELGDKRVIGRAYNNLGESERVQGDYASASSLSRQGLAIFQELGDKLRTAILLANLGYTAMRQGDYTRATALFSESLALVQELGSRDYIACCIAGFGGIAAGQSQPERAARLLGASHALLEGIGSCLEPIEQADFDWSVAATRSQLDEEAYSSAWAEGCAMTIEEAAAYALEA